MSSNVTKKNEKGKGKTKNTISHHPYVGPPVFKKKKKSF
jgi:hypothetical protein